METLELELTQVLHDMRCSARQAQALSIRLGWDGGGGATLATAAEATGYTRERVRQLEERVRVRLPGAGASMPLTTRALDLIEALSPAPSSELGERLAAAGLSSRPFDPAGVLRAAELAQLRTDVVQDSGILLRRSDADRMRRACRTAARLARGSGAVHLRAVAARLDEPPAVVRALLTLEPMLRWLDPEREWLALPARPSRSARALGKMLEVAGSLHLAQVDDGFRRLGPPLLLPRPVLRAYCAALPWLAVDPESDVVRPVEPIEAGRFLSGLEEDVAAIFAREQRPLRLSEVGRLAGAAGVNSTSAMLYAVRSPAFQTVGRGRYALRGSSPGTWARQAA
jgi:hypothetical protein